VHSQRTRLADPDGISAKAVIDGLVAGHLLPNDSAKVITEVSFSQAHGERDETRIEITWDANDEDTKAEDALARGLGAYNIEARKAVEKEYREETPI
jgi:hypothetical protein